MLNEHLLDLEDICQACGGKGIIDLGAPINSGGIHWRFYCNYCDLGKQYEETKILENQNN